MESEISPRRQAAVRMMENMGWTSKRASNRKWQFDRPDTGGLWDRVVVAHANLSPKWVAEIAMSYGDAPDLVEAVRAAKEAWLRARFLGIHQRFLADPASDAGEPSHD